MESLGFKRVEYTRKGLTFSMYEKDPEKVLHKQVLLNPRSGIIAKPVDTETKVISHPRNAKIGRLGCRVAEMFIMNTEQKEVFWGMTREHGDQSFIGAAQGFSDKFVIALGANAYEFNPLHLTLLKFTEEWRRYPVQHGHTIVA